MMQHIVRVLNSSFGVILLHLMPYDSHAMSCYLWRSINSKELCSIGSSQVLVLRGVSLDPYNITMTRLSSFVLILALTCLPVHGQDQVKHLRGDKEVEAKTPQTADPRG